MKPTSRPKPKPHLWAVRIGHDSRGYYLVCADEGVQPMTVERGGYLWGLTGGAELVEGPVLVYRLLDPLNN